MVRKIHQKEQYISSQLFDMQNQQQKSINQADVPL